MKKQIIAICILYMIVGCRKDQNVVYLAGKSENMILTEHDSVIYGLESFSTNPLTWCQIDLDGDDLTDVRFFFEMYENYDTLKNTYRVNVKIMNDQFNIAEIANSSRLYSNITDTIYDFIGTFPRATYISELTCDSIPDTEYFDHSNNPVVLYYGGQISSLFNWDNVTSDIQLRTSPWEDLNYYFNGAGDSIIGTNYISTGSCYGIPQDELCYIVFRKKIGTVLKFGWIELLLEGKDKLTIIRSGISV